MPQTTSPSLAPGTATAIGAASSAACGIEGWGCLLGVLHDYQATCLFDQRGADRAIIEAPGEHDRHDPVAEPAGRAGEHCVDGRAGVVHARAVAELDHSRGHQQVVVRRGHVDAPWLQRFACPGMRGGQWPLPLQELGQATPSLPPDVNRDRDRSWEIGRQRCC
jgi:hypothetical protein